jgi:hypothetical protein
MMASMSVAQWVSTLVPSVLGFLGMIIAAKIQAGRPARSSERSPARRWWTTKSALIPGLCLVVASGAASAAFASRSDAQAFALVLVGVTGLMTLLTMGFGINNVWNKWPERIPSALLNAGMAVAAYTVWIFIVISFPR